MTLLVYLRCPMACRRIAPLFCQLCYIRFSIWLLPDCILLASPFPSFGLEFVPVVLLLALGDRLLLLVSLLGGRRVLYLSLRLGPFSTDFSTFPMVLVGLSWVFPRTVQDLVSFFLFRLTAPCDA